MEFKSILVFSAAIVAMSSPSVANTSTFTGRENGEGDRLNWNETVRVPPAGGKQIRITDKVFPLNGWTVTRYEILDRTPEDETAAGMTLERTADTFKLIFQSQPGYGIYYDVKVYAKNRTNIAASA